MRLQSDVTTIYGMGKSFTGTLTKKDLPRGRWRHLNEQEMNNFSML